MGNVTFPLQMSVSGKYIVGFEFSRFHRGSRHSCYNAKFYDYKHYGPLHEENGVVRVRTDRPEMNKSYWQSHIDRTNQAQYVASQWNSEPSVVSKKRINIPILVCVEVDETSTLLSKLSSWRSRPVQEYEWVLVGRRINNVEQLSMNNSNRHSDLVAFSHYSWFISSGDIVIGHFKGQATDRNYYLLTPVIHSRDGRFGSKDEGQSGIDQFFRSHICNHLCKLFPHPGSNISFPFSQNLVRVQSGDEYLASRVLGMKSICIEKS